jgi:hypothetical protein
MQGNNYIFALQDKANNFYQIDKDGNVTVNSTPYFLDFSPSGWDEIAIQIIRNKNYFGVDRSVSIPLAYVKDGCKILKHILYNFGIEESVYLIIGSQKLDYTAGVNYGFWYKQIYKGEIDFSTFNHFNERVTCATLEDGLAKYLKANEKTKYELPMNVAEAINVKMDGVVLRQKSTFVVTNGYQNFNKQHVPNLMLISSEAYQSFNATSTDRFQVIDNASLFNSNNHFLTTENTSENTEIKIDFNFGVTVTTSLSVIPNCGSKLIVREFNLLGVATNSFDIVSYGNGHSLYQNHKLSGSVTFTGVPDRKYFLIMVYTIGGVIAVGSSADGVTSWIYDNGPNDLITANYTYRFKSTYIKAFRPQYIFDKLINLVTEGKYVADISGYLNNKYKNIVFVCGNSIRGLSDAVMKISFDDFFQHFDSFDSVGIVDYGKKIGFNERALLIDKDNFILLPEPVNGTLKISIAKDMLFNEYQTGYPPMDNDIGILNGNDEFNSKTVFSVGATKSPMSLDKVSKINASCYKIEGIRVTTMLKDTTDYKEDNNLFVIHIAENMVVGVGDIPDHYLLDRTLNATATGLLEPNSVFNLFLSPKRNLIRNGGWIRSLFYKGDSKKLSFTSSDKNSDVACGGIIEKADVNISDLAEPFLSPIQFDAEFSVPDDTLEMLDLNPLQVFKFPVKGIYYKGILMKGSVADSNKKTQQYSLLSLPENDLTKLIEYYG